MSTLRSVLDELGGEDLAGAPDEALEDGFAELQRASDVLEAEKLRRLSEIRRRQTYRRDGYLSVVAWLKDRCQVGDAEAARAAGVSRSLERMPLTREAFASGDLSGDAVRVLAKASDDHPEAFVDHEESLLATARSVPVRELRSAVTYWSGAIDHHRALEDGEHLHRRRRLHVSRTFLGMVRVDGDLDPECGELVLAALGAIADEEAKAGNATDGRTPAQRRADHLGELCRRFLGGRGTGTAGGERPHVSVLVDLPALQGAGGRCEWERGEPIHPQTARRILCDAGVSRVVTGGPSEILDVGRRTPVVPLSMRRAVVVRDGGCRFPGCGRPQSWCDAHHVVHWADGGETKVPNLLLLCRPHHRMVHEGQAFQVEMAEGRPSFRRTDGSSLEDRAPP